ncbi:hypothetical protein LTR10_004446 [Elasticomyces elasticus]|nr:hypothetical protein LTR10_004446 [Elasticomyces elasticus]KAK4976764.1 hypothetical protein LTR42_002809 [Elasticomyces elasticus]
MRELLTHMCKEVHTKEDYTLRYLMTEQLDAETPDFVMIETYKSKEAAQKHPQEPHFQELFGAFEKEGLFAKPPYLAHTTSKAGFDLDRSLL